MLKQIFRPATLLMNRLRFNLKFTLIVLLFLLPLLILAVNYFNQVAELSRHTSEELKGLQVFQSIDRGQRQLVQFLVKDMSWRSMQTPPAQLSSDLQQLMGSLNSLADATLLDESQFAALQDALQRLSKTVQNNATTMGNPQWNAVEKYERLEESLSQLNTFYLQVANFSGLTNDTQVDTVVLSRLLSEKRLLVLGLLARSYAVSAYALGEPAVSSGSLDALSRVSDRLAASLVTVKGIASASEGLDQTLQTLVKRDVALMQNLIEASMQFIEDQFLVAEEVKLDSNALASFFDRQITQYYDGGSSIHAELSARLQHRLDKTSRDIFTVAALVSGVLLVVIYLFIGMSLSISMTTRNLSRVAQQLADGDTQVAAAVHTQDELASALRAFNQMARKVHDLVNSVKDAAQGVADQSTQVERLAHQTGDAVNTQLQDTGAITSAVSELLHSVALVSDNSQKVIHALQRATQQTLAGRDTLAGARRATNELGDEIQTSVKVINQLSQQSDSINQVLDVIKSIAEQTNLLALNAAIEAARAGEQGRGFAVVADEVRSLAQRTHLSIEEIQSTITSLQQGVSSAVDAMQRSDAKARRSIDESAKLEQALDQITEAVDEIAQQNNATEQASQQQQALARQIEQNLQSISQISSVTEANVQQSMDASRQLADHVERLEKVVDTFKT